MAKRSGSSAETIVDIDVAAEMQSSFLEYAYSVIYSRALPDARDGLKPVQRRIVYQMGEMGLRPDRGHVKSSRIVGDVMGRLHPHGDSAIYDALVRMAQDFTMRLPLVDGHGNFGTLDYGPAAPRYTEARLTQAAMEMISGLDENVVDFVPNYDNTMTQPEVLPSAVPNLLVNGASGIAVGMATNMPPHNLGEIVAAAQHLIEHPDASLADLMRYVPGPDLPTGGRIVGLAGIREAYETGRGSFRTRAVCSIENLSARRKGIVVTELPYLVGPEKVIEKIKDQVGAKKLAGIASVDDFTDRAHGLRLVIGLKNGFDPHAVLEQLYRLTPLEDSFGINNVCLVDGQPRTLGLKELLEVYLEHRLSVVRRRTEFRLGKARDRLHLVEGLLIAILDIDEVIQLIRSSDDAGIARGRLMEVFDLSEIQATYILDLQLRRLTKFSRLELERERDELTATIAELEALLADRQKLLNLMSSELGEIAERLGTPRRTVLVEGNGHEITGKRGGRKALDPESMQIPDAPCWALLSTTGMLARTTDRQPIPATGKRVKHDGLLSQLPTTARAQIGAVTSTGRLVRLPVVDMPALPPQASRPSLAGGTPIREFTALDKGERVLGLVSLDEEGPGFALATAGGVVKRVAAEAPPNKDQWPVIALKPGDEVVGVAQLESGEEEFVFVSDAGQLLRFGASLVRPQGRGAGGVAGMKLSGNARVIHFSAIRPEEAERSVVVTIATGENYYGEPSLSAKTSALDEFPVKGRATGGVRAQRFLKGETGLVLAYAGPDPSASAASGAARSLPEELVRRDASGSPLEHKVEFIGRGPKPEGDAPAPGGAPGGGDDGGPGPAGSAGPELPVEEPESAAERISRLKQDDDEDAVIVDREGDGSALF
ncbi:DNA gyrase/topoisomerase IV subunit A [Sediminivirga luteola]|uniref:DNA gyrase/topoisomerase IV subunit A n=1 Tax=Sediminivirga luteola TaxID=1774748 RepID=UPI001F579391|nr:DNA topoisomerase IV subunit A [Sediminivirga luteola]MCI2265573.1 DNA topoisomerase IV subunit A [Sediminivirga luteola]